MTSTSLRRLFGEQESSDLQRLSLLARPRIKIQTLIEFVQRTHSVLKVKMRESQNKTIWKKKMVSLTVIY